MKESIRRTTIGGQALLEGIVMRGPDRSAIVVRKPDGEFVIKENENEHYRKDRIKKLPFIRGCVNFYRAMKEGISALTFSAQFYEPEEEEELSRFEKWLDRKFGSERMEKILMGFSVVVGIAVPIILFILVPTLVTGIFDAYLETAVGKNLVEGAIRIGIFVLFLALVSKMKDIKRTYGYHGAEHKTIHCYEKDLPLTVENVRVQPREHPRCGTSFLLIVIIISIIVFSFFSWFNPMWRVVIRLAMLPVVVSISYEIARFTGRRDNAFARIIRAPGMWLQRLTTKEPDDNMMQVSIEALKRVIPKEKGADAW